MKYIIKPYISVNDFFFGDTQSNVKKKCGSPFLSKIDNIQNRIVEEREGCELIFEKKKLVYATLNKHVEPIVNGLNIFSDGALDALIKLDSDNFIGPQYVLFRKLGICIGGISKKKIPEGKIVNVFSESMLDFFEFIANDS